MADRTLTINHADGGSETYTLKTEDVLGVRSMSVDGETVTIDRTAPDLVRTIIADGQTITIDTTREGVRTLTVDGTEIAIDRSEEANLESFLQEFTGASAAYSLRDLAGAGNTTVVRVRRSSDNAEADFKASEVSDGTLVAWVNAPTWTSAENSPTDPYDTFTDASLGGFSATLASGLGQAGFGGISGGSGQTVSVSFDLVVNSGSPALALRSSSGSAVVSSNAQLYSTSGSYQIDLTATGSFGFIGFSDASVPVDFTVSNFEVTAVSGNDGFVETWYDQSGNGNDATQSVAGSQPKIVAAGVLVSGGINFDGSQSFNLPTDIISSIDSVSSFLVAKLDKTTGTRIALSLSRNNPDKRYYLPALISGVFNFGYGETASAISLGTADTSKHLFSVTSGASTTEAFLDGTSKGTVSSTSGLNTLASGGISEINNALHWSGTMNEIIIYNSDQSANRAAIETNINNQYDIY